MGGQSLSQQGPPTLGSLSLPRLAKQSLKLSVGQAGPLQGLNWAPT